MSKNRAGFSLLELLVVIAIIGVLTSIGVLSFTSAQKRARDSVRRQHMLEMQEAMEQYFLIEQTYPEIGPVASVETLATTLVNDGYLKGNLPTDPLERDPHRYTFGWDTVNYSSYCFCARLENTGSGNYSSASCDTGGINNYYCVENAQ